MNAVPLTKAELLSLLDDMRTAVEADDSYEGSIEYLMPGPEDPEDYEFMVRASYRVGNSMGQGGVVLVGRIA